MRLLIAVLLVAGAAPPVAVDDTGRPPVVYLPFDGSVKDASSFGYRGRMEGDEVEFRPGVKGLALFVGGTEDWATVKLDDRLILSKGFTAELWILRENWENPYKGGSGWQTVAALNGFALNITAPGCPNHDPWAIEASVGKRLAEKDVVVSSAAGAILPDVWYHVALAYDPKAGETRLYLDGALVMDEATRPDLDVKYAEQPIDLTLGTWFKANQAFRGSIDELKIYDYARSASEIRRSATRAKR